VTNERFRSNGLIVLARHPDMVPIFAHEFSHRFGLADEYVEDCDTYSGPEHIAANLSI
jgi:hypothetical protein